jgi:hypothetical protein
VQDADAVRCLQYIEQAKTDASYLRDAKRASAAITSANVRPNSSSMTIQFLLASVTTS